MLRRNRDRDAAGLTTATMLWIIETASSGTMLPSPPLPKNAILSKILIQVFDVVPHFPFSPGVGRPSHAEEA